MIEILVVRDPDSENDITVWIDGVEQDWRDGINIVQVDAGAGYTFEDWRETADAWERDDSISDDFRRAVKEAYLDPPGRQYIQGFKELARYEFLCPKCGRVGTEDDLCVLGEECPADDCDGIIEHHWKDEG